jgi:hypothetical protein
MGNPVEETTVTQRIPYCRLARKCQDFCRQQNHRGLRKSSGAVQQTAFGPCPCVLHSVGMKCDLCGKDEATVHLTQTFGDMSKHVDLCEACAVANGVNDPTGFSLVTLMETVRKQKKLRSD